VAGLLGDFDRYHARDEIEPTGRTAAAIRLLAAAGVWHDRGTMSSPKTRRFPVTVTRLPVVRCQICRRTLAAKPGQANTVLTEHYRREHPEVLDAAANRPN
jgi:hypothetical protein